MKQILIFLLVAVLFSVSQRAQCQGGADDLEMEVEVEKEELTFYEKAGIGSFGTKLANVLNFVSLNGYFSNNVSYTNDELEYLQTSFNFFISAELTPKLVTEAMIQFERGGEETKVRYALADYKFHDALILRSGKFLMPIGEFNEYLFTDYVYKAINRSIVNEELSGEESWAGTGVQLRGKFNTNNSIVVPSYALFATTGLAGDNGEDMEDMIEMRETFQEDNNSNSAVGGQIALEFWSKLYGSLSYYNGKYSDDNELNLGITAFSLSYKSEHLNLFGEFQNAKQDFYEEEDSNDISQLNRNGFYLLGAYKFSNKFEPVLRYDHTSFDEFEEDEVEKEDKSRWTIGLNHYIKDNVLLKFNYERTTLEVEDVSTSTDYIGLQLALSF